MLPRPEQPAAAGRQPAEHAAQPGQGEPVAEEALGVGRERGQGHGLSDGDSSGQMRRGACQTCRR